MAINPENEALFNAAHDIIESKDIDLPTYRLDLQPDTVHHIVEVLKFRSAMDMAISEIDKTSSDTFVQSVPYTETLEGIVLQRFQNAIEDNILDTVQIDLTTRETNHVVGVLIQYVTTLRGSLQHIPLEVSQELRSQIFQTGVTSLISLNDIHESYEKAGGSPIPAYTAFHNGQRNQ